jgi:4-hydroxy-tetrahydrodipicolinate synthase
VAAAVHIPVILYNVPGRTSVDIPVSVYQCLAQIPNIVGVKEASTDISKIAKIRALCPDNFAIWSGNDDMAAAAMAVGAMGVISVVSNVAPEMTAAMAAAALDGDMDTAGESPYTIYYKWLKDFGYLPSAE